MQDVTPVNANVCCKSTLTGGQTRKVQYKYCLFTMFCWPIHPPQPPLSTHRSITTSADFILCSHHNYYTTTATRGLCHLRNINQYHLQVMTDFLVCVGKTVCSWKGAVSFRLYFCPCRDISPYLQLIPSQGIDIRRSGPAVLTCNHC